MTKHTIYCPECDGENVSITRKQSVEEKRVSIDELPLDRGPTLVPGVRMINHYIAVCQDCGYHREYSDGAATTLTSQVSCSGSEDPKFTQGSEGTFVDGNLKLTSGVPTFEYQTEEASNQ